MRIVNFFDSAESSTTPTLGNIVTSNLSTYANDAAFEAGEQGSPVVGNIYYNTTGNVVRYYNGSWTSIVDETTAQTVTNKSIDGLTNTVTNIDGDEVIIDPIVNLIATDAQGAFLEHQGEIETNAADIVLLEADVADIRTTQGTIDGDTDMGTYTGSTVSDSGTVKGNVQELETAVEARIEASEKGAANGVATLDGTSRIPAAQLPTSVMEYKGAWDANTNSPVLIDATGTNGDQYRTSVAGSQDLGAGSETYAIGDLVIYNGAVWQKVPAEDAVTTVNSQAGVVVLDTDDIAEGVTNEYYTEAKVTANTSVAANTAKVSFPEAPVDGNQYARKDAGWEEVVASGGSGSGSKNYSGNTNFETTDNVTSSNPGLTFALTAVAGEVVEGTNSLKLTKDAAERNGQYWQIQGLTIDPIEQENATTLHGSISLRTDFDVSYASDSIELQAFDQAGNQLALQTDEPLIKADVIGKIQYSITTNNTVTRVDIRLVIVTGSLVAMNISIDELSYGPSSFITTAIQKDWEEYTPTLVGFGTATAVNTWFKRVGDSIQIRGKFASGTSTAVPAEISFPSGFVADINKITSLQIVGDIIKGAATTNQWSAVASGGDAFIQIVEENNGNFASDANGVVSSGQVLYFTTGLIPIAGLTSGALLSTTEANNNQASIAIIEDQKASGTGGGTSTSNTIHTRVLNTVVSDIDNIVSLSGNQFTLQPGKYKVRSKAPHFFSADRTKLFIHDGTSYVVEGINDYQSGINISQLSTLEGVLNPTVPTTYTLRHWIQTGKAVDGLGLNTNNGINPQTHETYSQVIIERIPKFTTFGVYRDNIKSKIDVLTSPGYGSTGNRVLRFSTIQEDIGPAITYASDGVNGDTFTINESGQYSVAFQFESTDPDREYAITKNQTALTNNPTALPNDEFMLGDSATASRRNSINLIDNFLVGDVLRASADGGAIAGVVGDCRFKIIKLL